MAILYLRTMVVKPDVRRTLSILAFASFGVMALSLTAQADYFSKPVTNFREAPGTLTLSPDANYYSSSSNFDATAAKFRPAGFLRYDRIDTNAQIAYGLNKYLTAFGRLSWARVQIDHQTIPTDAFGLTDQLVGFTVHAFDVGHSPRTLPVSFDFQLQSEFPLYDNTTAAKRGALFLGDGSVNYTGLMFLTWPFAVTNKSSWTTTVGGGFTKRTENFSSALPWSFKLSYLPRSEGFLFGLGCYGQRSLQNDPNAIRTSVGRLGNGLAGSYAVNAINPSLAVIRGELGYRIGSRIAVMATGSHALWGQAAPVGYSLGIALQATLLGNGTGNPANMSPIEYGKSNQGFVNYSFEGRVLRINDRMNLIKMDKGSQDGVEINQVFDIFVVKKNGTIGDAVARAKCTSANSNESVLTVTEYFKEVWIEEGYLVKRPLN